MRRRAKGSARLPVFIFDFGGVVIKWRNNNPIFDHVADIYGIPRAEMRRELEHDLPRLEAGEVSMRDFLEAALAKFGKHLRKGDSPDELWSAPFERLVKFRAGTVRLIEGLRKKGFMVYLFSNTSRPHVKLFKKLGWDQLADGFLFSCELGSTKPSSTAFERALASAGLKPSEVVFVDDRAENVEGAKRHGIRWAFTFKSVAQLRKDIAPILAASKTGKS